jgi:DNA-directed RNA polymerase specialized sigma24 family protein
LNKINALYASWAAEKTDQKLSELLQLVTLRIRQRYCEVDTNFEDIAQDATLEVWQFIMRKDFVGNDFAKLCATIARRSRKDMLRSERLTATKEETLESEMGQYADDQRGY